MFRRALHDEIYGRESARGCSNVSKDNDTLTGRPPERLLPRDNVKRAPWRVEDGRRARRRSRMNQLKRSTTFVVRIVAARR